MEVCHNSIRTGLLISIFLPHGQNALPKSLCTQSHGPDVDIDAHTTLRLIQEIGKTIHVTCDNMTIIAQLNKFGGTRAQPLPDLTIRIWHHCMVTVTGLKTT
ncbi:hypothetical protein KI688_006778 [Linnemannia hyalina]|uniref:Uncharacterized protein n=1 Tax=Linnemannia hyalina TaxID=64524 RepID=A0A9P7XM62_9FUNG|nr:hypothetical protein KI688_006778 [Linnemannia hyalina]